MSQLLAVAPRLTLKRAKMDISFFLTNVYEAATVGHHLPACVMP